MPCRDGLNSRMYVAMDDVEFFPPKSARDLCLYLTGEIPLWGGGETGAGRGGC